MGFYFLLKKLEFSTECFHNRVVEGGAECTDAEKDMLMAADEISKTIGEMREVFSIDQARYQDGLRAYESNKVNGYYDKGFGIIEGWFMRHVYLAINLRRYEEYFNILKRVEFKLNQGMTMLRFRLVTQKM